MINLINSAALSFALCLVCIFEFIMIITINNSNKELNEQLDQKEEKNEQLQSKLKSKKEKVNELLQEKQKLESELTKKQNTIEELEKEKTPLTDDNFNKLIGIE